jgi:hypothetical protein
VNENMSIYEENILGIFLPELLEVAERVGKTQVGRWKKTGGMKF